jgi:hypothetical protein
MVYRLKTDGSKVVSEKLSRDNEQMYDLGDGVTVAWEKDKPSFSVRTANGAKVGTKDFRLDYLQFTIGTGQHILGIRVIIQSD